MIFLRRHVLVLVFLLGACFGTQAQAFEYLRDIKLKKDSDFIKNEKTILDCVDFLSINRLNQDYQDRNYCNNFIGSYGNKTPFVTIGIESYVTRLMKKNTDLL